MKGRKAWWLLFLCISVLGVLVIHPEAKAQQSSCSNKTTACLVEETVSINECFIKGTSEVEMVVYWKHEVENSSWCDDTTPAACDSTASCPDGESCQSVGTEQDRVAFPDGKPSVKKAFPPRMACEEGYEEYTLTGKISVNLITECSCEPCPTMKGTDTSQCPCASAINIPAKRVHPGKPLGVEVKLFHRRDATVTTPFFLSLLDHDGEVVDYIETREYTLHPEDALTLHRRVTIPDNISPGEYRLEFGIGEMEQGFISTATTFEVVE